MATITQVTWDGGVVVEERQVTSPAPVIDPDTLRLAKRTARNMVGKYTDANGAPTGTVTQADARNWLLALTVGLRWLVNEMDDEAD